MEVRSTKSATLQEVASQAGVSTATVARVLKGRGYVSAEARIRVETALKSTGYRPNAMARGLRTQRSDTIGHILTAITVNPFFVNVARGVEEAAFERGYKTFLFNHNGRAERERLGVERFIERRDDAVLFTTAVEPENLELLAAAGIPAIQIERAASADFPLARVDNAVGAREALRHLTGLGHRRIAFVGGDPALVARRDPLYRVVEDERIAAYREGLEAAGIPFDPALVRIGRYYDLADGSGAEGYTHMRALLALADRPTAIFATCDILAAGVLQAIYDAGLRVPHDISVIGFDDTLAVNLTPPLTTVAQPMAALGRAGFALGLVAVDGRPIENPPPLETRLVIRRSTGPAP